MEGASPEAALLLGAIALVALSGLPGLLARGQWRIPQLFRSGIPHSGDA